ncbi:MAG TPA: heparin lyase I family protein [Pseudobdellovibrionaceae bacterium]|jgi:hypothetical protein
MRQTIARAIFSLSFLLCMILNISCSGSGSGYGSSSSYSRTASASTITAARAAPGSAQEALADRVQKLFSAKCLSCHNAQKASGNINLSTATAILQRGLVIKGNAAGSQLYQSLVANRMPVGGGLDDASKKDVQDWINQGPFEFPSTFNGSLSVSKQEIRPAISSSSFFGDWESGTLTGSGNYNWSQSQISTKSSYTLLNDGGGRQGSYYARVSVAPRRCRSCVERSEVVQMQDAQNHPIVENESSEIQRYSFSVKFDSSWKPIVGNRSEAWGIFLQLRSPNTFPTRAAWAFNASNTITFRQRGGNLRYNKGKIYPLSNNSLNTGKWIDFVLTIKYAKDNTGFFRIHRRDEGETTFTEVLNVTEVPTLQTRDGVVADHVIRHGLSRNHHNFTSILYLDGFTRETVSPTPAPIPTPNPSPTPTPPPATNALADRVQKILIAKCVNCHNVQMPSGNVSNLTSARVLLEKGLVTKGNATTSRLYQVVATNQMPLGIALDEASKKDIADWINAGAPEFTSNLPQPTPTPPLPDPTRIPQSVLDLAADEETIYQDLQQIAAETRAFTRYIVITQNYNSTGILTAQKALFAKGISKTLNSLHWKNTISIPVALNPESTALRIDLRNYDLTAAEWSQITATYPYLNQLKASSRWNAIVSATKSTKPIVRGDWFVQQVLQPTLYKQLLEIPENIQTLETRLGVNAEERLRSGAAIRAGLKDSGVSFSNRIAERYESSYGAYWKSYDFISSDGNQNIFRNPLGPVLDNFSQGIGFVHNGGEMIFTLPNGLHGYALTSATGNYLNTAPPEIVIDTSRADKLVTNGSSCFTCHTQGLIPFEDEISAASNRGHLFNNKQLTAINRLYIGKTKLEETFNKDMAAYVDALDKLQISPDSGEPVSTVNLFYARNLQIKDIAAELQLSVTDLRKYLESSSGLRSQFDFTNSHRVSTVKITRALFEQRFNQILQEVAKLKP